MPLLAFPCDARHRSRRWPDLGSREFTRPLQEILMKNLYLLAALLMASTAAHAGNSVSLQIGGHKIHIEAPKNCDKLSCLQISPPSLSGSDLFKGLKSSRDDDDVASRADPPAQKAGAAPVDQAASPKAPVAAASSAPSASKEAASTPTVSENITS